LHIQTVKPGHVLFGLDAVMDDHAHGASLEIVAALTL
jgi:hypothetical protein